MPKLTTNYDNFVCIHVCIYAQTAITKKQEVETRLKFTIRYKINWRGALCGFLKQRAKFFYSNLIPRIIKISSPIGFCTTKTDVNHEKEKKTSFEIKIINLQD